MAETILEVIVVEGEADVAAVKAAVPAKTIAVGGFGVRRPEVIEAIRFAQETRGVIVLTDPDTAGEQIRAWIESQVPGVRHAYIGRAEGKRERDGRIGVEYASKETIQSALAQAQCRRGEVILNFTIHDLFAAGLVSCAQARGRRERLGVLLRVGYANAKQLLNKLNHFGISRELFWEAIEQIDGETRHEEVG